MIIGAGKYQGVGEEMASGQEHPPIRAFMDDLTLLNPSINNAEAVLNKLSKVMIWACMKIQAKKYRSLVLKRGNIDEQYKFELRKETILTVSQQPVNNLSR